MTYSPDDVRAALLLTNRVVPLAVKPLTAREFWQVIDTVAPGDLLAFDAGEIGETTGLGREGGERLRTLLDAVTALGFEEERLRDGGVELVSSLDERFPSRLRDRLGPACPTFLLVAGPIKALAGPALGIVGSRDASEAACEVARSAGAAAVVHDWAVVSGLARGIDQAAMSGANDAGGVVVGVPADGIVRAARSAEVRSRVHAGALSLASPYAPDAPFRAGNALGRNKIIFGLSRVTLVVACDRGSGGTWSGATEALQGSFAHVAVWIGDGAAPGNHALAERGAHPITALDELFDFDSDIEPPAPEPTLF